jgi:hypothetical protein
MKTTITDFPSVRQKALALDCIIPDGIALLPTNFTSVESKADFLQPSEAATVRSLFRNYNIVLEELVLPAERPAYIQNNSFEWVAPTLFIVSSLMTENSAIVSVAMNVLSSYVFEFFKGIPGEKTVKLDIVVEKKGDHSCKMIHYEGDPAGLNALPEIIRRISDG